MGSGFCLCAGLAAAEGLRIAAVGGGVPDAPRSGQDRSLRCKKINGRQRQGCGPGMPGPYRAFTIATPSPAPAPPSPHRPPSGPSTPLPRYPPGRARAGRDNTHSGRAAARPCCAAAATMARSPPAPGSVSRKCSPLCTPSSSTPGSAARSAAANASMRRL